MSARYTRHTGSSGGGGGPSVYIGCAFSDVASEAPSSRAGHFSVESLPGTRGSSLLGGIGTWPGPEEREAPHPQSHEYYGSSYHQAEPRHDSEYGGPYGQESASELFETPNRRERTQNPLARAGGRQNRNDPSHRRQRSQDGRREREGRHDDDGRRREPRRDSGYGGPYEEPSVYESTDALSRRERPGNSSARPTTRQDRNEAPRRRQSPCDGRREHEERRDDRSRRAYVPSRSPPRERQHSRRRQASPSPRRSRSRERSNDMPQGGRRCNDTPAPRQPARRDPPRAEPQDNDGHRRLHRYRRHRDARSSPERSRSRERTEYERQDERRDADRIGHRRCEPREPPPPEAQRQQRRDRRRVSPERASHRRSDPYIPSMDTQRQQRRDERPVRPERPPREHSIPRREVPEPSRDDGARQRQRYRTERRSPERPRPEDNPPESPRSSVTVRSSGSVNTVRFRGRVADPVRRAWIRPRRRRNPNP